MDKIKEIRQKAEEVKKTGCFRMNIAAQDVINLCDALKLATDYLEEWRKWYEKMGKHQEYDFRDKLKDIDQILERDKDG